MSHDSSLSPEDLPQELSQPDRVGDWWKRFQFHFLILRDNSRWLFLSVIPVLIATVGLFEVRTSGIEARILSTAAAKLSYTMGQGASPSITFPSGGPYNEIRGYASLPRFEHRLMEAGFRIVAQARLSPELERLASWKITPPFREPAVAGLSVRGENGTMLYDAGSREVVFNSYEDIPPLVTKALLLVENRELKDSDAATRNPVIDWGRLSKAGLMYAGHKIGLPFPVEGGSTLATQIEKFRYADGGRTNSAGDKLRQMISASLRVYREGPDTRAERRDIVLDYLNSVPLAAAAQYGEVYGLGNGLYAWFGINLNEARLALTQSSSQEEKERIFKHVMALICAARAPSFYLEENRQALEARVDFYTRELEANGTITSAFARGVESAHLAFRPRAPAPQPVAYVERKAANAFRTHLMEELAVPNLYTLDRLHLDADTTLNVDLQNKVLRLFEHLKDPAFVESQGLRQKYLLLRGDPAQVTYSFTLFERTPAGNMLRVQADTLNQPFDLNEGMKLELGSTAKLRTLAHYLELITSLYHEFHGLDAPNLIKTLQSARDPITRWTAETMSANEDIDLTTLLQKSLDREYSGNPGEIFFTGGGAHIFANFEKEENARMFTLRDGLAQSVNLVYVRLMRDLVRFHEERLPYDTQTVLNNPDDPVRLRMLNEIADTESRHVLLEAYETYRRLDAESIVERILGSRGASSRRLAMLFLAWNSDADAGAVARWLESHGVVVSADEANQLYKSYDPERLNISDYGYLLSRHPLEVWCAGQLFREPLLPWDNLLKRSADVREAASHWLFQTKNRRAQDLRLRIRFEEDAFARMTPYWQRLGFPFDHLVPSLATAIGSSADRPVALAELIGIVLNDGVRLPMSRVERLRFAAGTPYETVFEPKQQSGERVMEPEIAWMLRDVLTGVVENGTASRVAHVFVGQGGRPIMAGGKTGSGDNRYETVGRGGYRTSSRAISRTGTFVFYIGERYFGVVTAYVSGDQAAQYLFTSALPVTALKLLAPALISSLSNLE
jgi:membrane peptidoglycan carboxypeptidase